MSDRNHKYAVHADQTGRYMVSVIKNVGPTNQWTDIDIAWLAGFYEGEGTIKCSGNRINVRISQKDPETLYRTRELIGGSIHIVRADSEQYYCHVLSVYGDNARRFIQAIYPFLSERRKEQVENAGGLRPLTGFRQGVGTYDFMSEERDSSRGSMSEKQKAVESVIAYRERNLEKVHTYQRERAATIRTENPERHRAANRKAYEKRKQLKILNQPPASGSVELIN